MELTIVSTLYCSAPYLEEFYTRMSGAARNITGDYEMILVNDGSPDNSLDIAVELHEKDGRVKVMDLSRNFGHHKAMMTGLAHARGERVLLIDCDLEEEPELIEEFYSRMESTNADVVYGTQISRKGGWFEKWTGSLFYKAFNFLSEVKIPENVLTMRLMTRRYVASLITHRDREVFLLGLWTITGFKQVPIAVRKHGKKTSTYNIGRKLGILVNALTSFSSRPLILVFYIGGVISLLAGGAAGWLIIRRLFFEEFLGGWPSLIVSIWLLGGVNIFCIGLVGVYLSKVFSETKSRPYTIIRNIHEKKENSENEVQFDPQDIGKIL